MELREKPSPFLHFSEYNLHIRSDQIIGYIPRKFYRCDIIFQKFMKYNEIVRGADYQQNDNASVELELTPTENHKFLKYTPRENLTLKLRRIPKPYFKIINVLQKDDIQVQ